MPQLLKLTAIGPWPRVTKIFYWKKNVEVVAKVKHGGGSMFIREPGVVHKTPGLWPDTFFHHLYEVSNQCRKDTMLECCKLKGWDAICDWGAPKVGGRGIWEGVPAQLKMMVSCCCSICCCWTKFLLRSPAMENREFHCDSIQVLVANCILNMRLEKAL